MIELRWRNRQLQHRQKSIGTVGGQVVLHGWGKWQTVQQASNLPAFVRCAREVVDAFEEHGVGPQFPELQAAIEKLQAAFEESIWSRV